MPYILNNNEKIIKCIKIFSKDCRPKNRYSSFDYCFGYFQSFKNKKLIASKRNLEKSCLHIVSYLASWGMYRGSSFLLKEKSIKHFTPLIKWISNCPSYNWQIDLNDYNDLNIKHLLKTYLMIEKKLQIGDKRGTVLVTKIMLGIFGNIPAFDRNFCQTFKSYFRGNPAFSCCNSDALKSIKEFYDKNSKLIDSQMRKYKLYVFNKKKKSDILYTRAKIVDMIGFAKSIK